MSGKLLISGMGVPGGLVFGRGMPGKLFGGKGYLISFSVFCVCILVGIVIYQMNSELEEYIGLRVDDEIDADRVWLAEFVARETYVESEEWLSGFREYCGLEGLRCGIVNGVVFVKGEKAYSLS